MSTASLEPDFAQEGAAVDDRPLVARVKAGDRAAAEELVEVTYAGVFASLVRMCGDRDLAADLTQETYRKAWEALREFDGRARFSTWLYRIAWTTFLNHIRRPRRVVSMEEAPREPRDERVSAEEEVAERQSNEELRRAVLTLPEDLRFTVTAHFWGEHSVTEIAQLEKVTTVAIRKRLKRAYAALEAAIRKG